MAKANSRVGTIGSLRRDVAFIIENIQYKKVASY
jgi:hypothetical protein